jgi:hypothetical protein
LKIDITKDMYVGYLLSTYTGYPISVDDGPAIDGYGNMILTGIPTEWVTLLQMNPELDYNWNIKAFFERDGIQYESYYRVFRSIDGNEPEMIAETMDNEFTDPVSLDTGLYCYKVKALYYAGCESVYSPESCVLLTDIPSRDQELKGFVKIYPNPASEALQITSSEKMQSISMYDSKGDMVIRWEGDKGRHEEGGTRGQGEGEKRSMSLKGLAPGLYLVRVETEKGMVVRKVVVRR